jgi:hypothetical protein
MKEYKDLLQDYQDLLSEINYVENLEYSMDNESELVYLMYMMYDMQYLIDLHYKEEFNKV